MEELGRQLRVCLSFFGVFSTGLFCFCADPAHVVFRGRNQAGTPHFRNDYMQQLGESEDAGVVNEFPAYWSDVHKHMHCCASVKFLRYDANNNPWHSDLLAKKVCNAATELSDSKDPMQIENVALIAHSMGNLVIANALMNNQCQLGESSKWIALQGPIEGSMSSTRAMDVCRDGMNKIKNDKILEMLQFKLCPSTAGVRSLAYREAPSTTQDLNVLYEKALAQYKSRVDANMCGVSPTGLFSKISIKYTALSIFSQHPTAENDGAVDFNSCRAGMAEDKYEEHWQSRFYKAGINHGDGALKNGNGHWGANRMPLKWLQQQLCTLWERVGVL